MGNGLGLSIVHKIITLHKGSIICESTISKGTSFTISLPITE
ncbi:MAG: HAMP domain-containing histidine kinase, partial [Turicibacter sp.]|nr:HAMP domain-containing histidine kinase [Turicibacter sp.]